MANWRWRNFLVGGAIAFVLSAIDWKLWIGWIVGMITALIIWELD